MHALECIGSIGGARMKQDNGEAVKKNVSRNSVDTGLKEPEKVRGIYGENSF